MPGLRGKVDPVEFRDVDTQADGDVIRVAIEVLKVHARIEHAPFLVQLTLYAYLAAVVIEKDAGLVLNEPASLIEFRHDIRFVNTRRRGEVDVVGESGILEICFPEAVASFED